MSGFLSTRRCWVDLPSIYSACQQRHWPPKWFSDQNMWWCKCCVEGVGEVLGSKNGRQEVWHLLAPLSSYVTLLATDEVACFFMFGGVDVKPEPHHRRVLFHSSERIPFRTQNTLFKFFCFSRTIRIQAVTNFLAIYRSILQTPPHWMKPWRTETKSGFYGQVSQLTLSKQYAAVRGRSVIAPLHWQTNPSLQIVSTGNTQTERREKQNLWADRRHGQRQWVWNQLLRGRSRAGGTSIVQQLDSSESKITWPKSYSSCSNMCTPTYL